MTAFGFGPIWVSSMLPSRLSIAGNKSARAGLFPAEEAGAANGAAYPAPLEKTMHAATKTAVAL